MSKKKVSKKIAGKVESKKKVPGKKKAVRKSKGKNWKQGSLELPIDKSKPAAVAPSIVDGRIQGRFHDTELAQEMGRAGGGVGGNARVLTTSEEFRRLNCLKAARYRWNPNDWTDGDELALEEARIAMQKENES